MPKIVKSDLFQRIICKDNSEVLCNEVWSYKLAQLIHINILVILLPFAIPAMAANDLQTMRASLLLDGGLKYEESTGRYILYGRATGIVENKTVTAKLLK